MHHDMMHAAVNRAAGAAAWWAAGVGTCIVDTTPKKPVWSTGSAWVDAMGKPV